VDVVVAQTESQTAQVALACVEATINFFLSKNLGITKIYIVVDGGPTYKCKNFVSGLSLVDPRIVACVFHETGDGKSSTDVHFSYVGININQYVNSGRNMLSPYQLCAALKKLKRYV